MRNVAHGRSATKPDRVQQVNVIAQIHMPRAKGDSNSKLKIVQLQPSSQGEPSGEESPTSVEDDGEEHPGQGSSGVAKPRNLGESISCSSTAQDGNGTMEETAQSSKIDEGNGQCDQPGKKESITLDQQRDEDFTSLKTSDNHKNTKPGLSGPKNGSDNETSPGKPQDDDRLSSEVCEEHADDLEQSQCADVSEGNKPKKLAAPEQSKNDGAQLEENCVVKPLENGAHPNVGQSSGLLNHSEEAEDNTTPEVAQLEGSTEKNDVENSGSSMKEESSVVKPLENGVSQHHLTKAQDNTRSKLDQLESSTERNEVEHSGSTMTEERCVVQPLENGETSVSTTIQEPLEEAVGVHLLENDTVGVNLPENETNPEDAQLNGSGNRMKDQPLENTEKVNGQRSASSLTDFTPAVKQDDIQEEAFHEGDSISECSWHSKASESRNQSTPFENDTTDESDSDGSIHTSDSFNFIEDEGKAKILHSKAVSGDGVSVDPNSVSNGHQWQLRKGSEKAASKISPAPEVGFRTIVPIVQPIEDGGKSGKEHKGNNQGNSCQTCPARQSCSGTENSKGRQDVRKPEADDIKQSTVIAGGKVAQQRPSAPVKIPTPQNRLLAKLRDTQSGSGGSKLSECGSFVSAVGSIHSGNSVESFHSARSGSSSSQSRQARSKDDNDHHSDGSHSSDDMPHVLPISSSFVDVICAVNRVAAFACHLCKILCPDESPQRGEHAAAACSTSGDDDLRNESLGIKRRLYDRLIQVLIIR